MRDTNMLRFKKSVGLFAKDGFMRRMYGCIGAAVLGKYPRLWTRNRYV